MTQLTLELRDESLTRVLDNAGDDWRESVALIVAEMPEHELTGEDIRLECESRGVGPHHNNAWGGIVNHLIRQGVLQPTGRYQAMKAPGSHARKTQVYRKS